MTDDYLTAAAAEFLAYAGSMTITGATDVLVGIVHKETAGIAAERDRARDIAVTLENQLAAATALHTPRDYGTGEDHHVRLCPECIRTWPCTTALALGLADVDADIALDAAQEVSA